MMKRNVLPFCLALLLSLTGCGTFSPSALPSSQAESDSTISSPSGKNQEDSPEPEEGIMSNSSSSGKTAETSDSSRENEKAANREPDDTGEPEPDSTAITDSNAETQQASEKLSKEIDAFLARMTPEEKAAQLFIVLPEALVDVDTVTAAGEATRQALNETPVGGFVYMPGNLLSREQVQTMLGNLQTYSRERIGLPFFTCLDEEGGTVTRIGGRDSFDVPRIGDMSDYGAAGDVEGVREAGETIGSYLKELGFNLDFAPVADVFTNPANEVVRYRSFGGDARMVSACSLAFLQGLESRGVYGTYKHFPGHGATSADTHEDYAATDKTLEELWDNELLPFRDGVSNGVKFIMAGHISLPNVTGDHTPASLSPVIIQNILREQMGYDGIVITDAMNMGAISRNYTSAQAAVMALRAGADMILMPSDFRSAYQGVLDALNSGELSMERMDESLRRILRVKLTL